MDLQTYRVYSAVLIRACNAQVFLRDDRLRWWHKHSRAHHENWLQKFFGQPCNGELFVKQAMNMESAHQLQCLHTPARLIRCMQHACTRSVSFVFAALTPASCLAPQQMVQG